MGKERTLLHLIPSWINSEVSQNRCSSYRHQNYTHNEGFLGYIVKIRPSVSDGIHQFPVEPSMTNLLQYFLFNKIKNETNPRGLGVDETIDSTLRLVHGFTWAPTMNWKLPSTTFRSNRKVPPDTDTELSISKITSQFDLFIYSFLKGRCRVLSHNCTLTYVLKNPHLPITC